MVWGPESLLVVLTAIESAEIISTSSTKLDPVMKCDFITSPVCVTLQIQLRKISENIGIHLVHAFLIFINIFLNGRSYRKRDAKGTFCPPKERISHTESHYAAQPFLHSVD